MLSARRAGGREHFPTYELLGLALYSAAGPFVFSLFTLCKLYQVCFFHVISTPVWLKSAAKRYPLRWLFLKEGRHTYNLETYLFFKPWPQSSGDPQSRFQSELLGQVVPQKIMASYTGLMQGRRFISFCLGPSL